MSVDTNDLIARLAGGVEGLALAVWQDGIPADGPVAKMLAEYERWKLQPRSTPATEQALFLNRLRSLFSIDGDLLPELTESEQREFVRDPVRYLIRTDAAQAAAIWREVEKRQRREA